MARGGARSALRWAMVLVLLLGSALVAATALQGEDAPEASDPVVGELKLADDDEGPRDRVEHTFGAANLAPGDTRADELVISREPFEDLPPALEPRVAITLHGDGSSLLAGHLDVTSLTYGDEGLIEQAIEACGEPLTLARLAACTRTGENPLSELPDPTPEGTSFRLGVQLAPEASSDLEDRSYGFTARVELYGRAPSGPAEPPSVSSLADPPLERFDRSKPSATCTEIEPADRIEPTTEPLLVSQVIDDEPPASVRTAGALWDGGPRPSALLGTWLPPSC